MLVGDRTLRETRGKQSPGNSQKIFLHGTSLAMYISGQERRLVNPPSQVVAGVRTVTTNMNGREHSHVRAHSLF